MLNFAKKEIPASPRVKAPAAEETKGPKWWMRGKKVHDAAEKEAREQEERREASRRAIRFALAQEEEALITFIDGYLDDNGLLDALSYRAHQIKTGANRFENYICTADIEPCPICESSEKGKFPSLVSAFSVIDHREYTTKNGVVIPWTRKLFLAKKNTFKLLQRIASKHGGLVGVTLEVYRTSGDTTPSVGSHFEFTQKDDIAELRKHFTRLNDKKEKVCEFEPIDYLKEIVYRSAAQLRELGFGSGTAPVGSEGKRAAAKFDDEV